jgi:hypothetical protein
VKRVGKMNALWGLFILASIIYGIVIDGTFWKIYLGLVGVWYLFVLLQRDKRDNGKRKTMLISTWGEPSDPTSYIVNEISMSKCKEYVK